jgi:hypothetical protein
MSRDAIRILFIKKAKSDVMVEIRCIAQNSFTLTYSGAGLPTQTVVDSDEVYAYLMDVLDLCKYDAEPFEHVQFDVPLWPSSLFRTEDLTERKELIMRTITFSLNHMLPPYRRRRVLG